MESKKDSSPVVCAKTNHFAAAGSHSRTLLSVHFACVQLPWKLKMLLYMSLRTLFCMHFWAFQVFLRLQSGSSVDLELVKIACVCSLYPRSVQGDQSSSIYLSAQHKQLFCPQRLEPFDPLPLDWSSCSKASGCRQPWGTIDSVYSTSSLKHTSYSASRTSRRLILSDEGFLFRTDKGTNV